MAVNTTTFESTLQTKLDDTTLAAKEMLLLGKALESTVGSIAVSDINTAGANKVSEINTVATNTFKTVGGTSILGSGDIATLPSGGTAGQVLKKDGSNNPAWGTDEGGKVLQIIQDIKTDDYGTSSGGVITNLEVTITPSSTASKILVIADLTTSSNNGQRYGTWLRCNGSNILEADAAGPRNRASKIGVTHSDAGSSNPSISYLHSPNSTSAQTYNIYGDAEASSWFWCNRNHTDAYDNTWYRGTSSITVMEIGA